MRRRMQESRITRITQHYQYWVAVYKAEELTLAQLRQRNRAHYSPQSTGCFGRLDIGSMGCTGEGENL